MVSPKELAALDALRQRADAARETTQRLLLEYRSSREAYELSIARSRQLLTETSEYIAISLHRVGGGGR